MPTFPTLFTVGMAGEQRTILQHGDGSLVSAENPARRGETLAAWATGVGRLSPPLADGAVAPLEPPFPALADLFELRINLGLASIVYAGAAPGLVSGVAQINFVVPPDATPGEGQIVLQTKDETFGAAGRVWVEP